MARPSARSMTFNDSFFETLGKSEPVEKLITTAAGSVEQLAKSTAPVGETGNYRDRIHVEIKIARYRKVALVIAGDEKSLLIEAKTGNLARALKAAKI